MAVEASEIGATPAAETAGKGTKIIELGVRDRHGGANITIAGPLDMTIKRAQLLARTHFGGVADEMSFLPAEPVEPEVKT